MTLKIGDTRQPHQDDHATRTCALSRRATGDTNPMHLDDAYAAATRSGGASLTGC